MRISRRWWRWVIRTIRRHDFKHGSLHRESGCESVEICFDFNEMM
jgi:hypothetical protein